MFYHLQNLFWEVLSGECFGLGVLRGGFVGGFCRGVLSGGFVGGLCPGFFCPDTLLSKEKELV